MQVIFHPTTKQKNKWMRCYRLCRTISWPRTWTMTKSRSLQAQCNWNHMRERNRSLGMVIPESFTIFLQKAVFRLLYTNKEQIQTIQKLMAKSNLSSTWIKVLDLVSWHSYIMTSVQQQLKRPKIVSATLSMGKFSKPLLFHQVFKSEAC